MEDEDWGFPGVGRRRRGRNDVRNMDVMPFGEGMGGDMLDRSFVDFHKMLRAPVTMDLMESDKEYLLTVRHPNIRKQDLKIDLNENVLTISGERSKEQKTGSESEGNYYYRSSSSAFQRSMTLPENVDLTKIAAKHEGGMLKISLPKLAGAKQNRQQIQIQ